MNFVTMTSLGWLAFVGLAMGTYGSDKLAETKPGASTAHHFHLAFDLFESKLWRRDQVFITANGFLTGDRSQATVFTISNGQLLSDHETVSANPADDYIIFAANATMGSISTTWTKDPYLKWSNPKFASNGVATYCQDPNSRVFIVLHSPPSACTPRTATTVPLQSATATSSTVRQIESSTMSQTDISTTSQTDTSITSPTETSIASQTNTSTISPTQTSTTSQDNTSTISPTETSTISQTNTSSTIPLTPSLIAPTATGIAYYGYRNPPQSDFIYPPDQYNGNKSYEISGVADDINFTTDGNMQETFPGQISLTLADHYTVIYQGYFNGQIGDTYSLTTTRSTDNEGWIWIGDTAKSAWNDTNFSAHSVFPSDDGPVTFTLDATGTIPVTIMWENSGGPGALHFAIEPATTGVTREDTSGYFLLPVTGDGFSNSPAVATLQS